MPYFSIISPIFVGIEFLASLTLLFCAFLRGVKKNSTLILIFGIYSLFCNVFLTVSTLYSLSEKPGLITGDGSTLIENFFLAIILTVTLLCSVVFIAKGTTRIAETSARFCLDAFPNKMLSIDYELKANKISEEKSKELKHQVQANMNNFATLDWTAKTFFKIVIVTVCLAVVNIVGGMIIEKFFNGNTWLETINLSVILATKNIVLFVIPQLITLFSIIFKCTPTIK